MVISVRKSVVAVFALVAVMPLLSHAESYASTNKWINVAAADANLDASPWTEPTASGSSVEKVDGKIKVTTEYNDPLTYTATVGTSHQVVSFRMVISSGVSVPEVTDFENAQAAIGVVTNKTAQRLEWIVLQKSGDNLSFVSVASPALLRDGDEWDVLVETDNRTELKKIRYAVKPAPAKDYTYLTELIDNPLENPGYVTAFDFAGEGSFGDFYGANVIDHQEITPKGSDVPVAFNRVLMDAMELTTPDQIKAWSKDSGANGLPNWQSYVLGYITAEHQTISAADKPILVMPQNSSADYISFKLGNVSVNDAANVKVTYDVEASNSPNFTDSSQLSTGNSASSTTPITLPTDSAVKYYRLRLNFTNTK